MTQGSFRLAMAVAALAALWIVVYWWTPAAPRPSIAFQPSPEPAPVEATPETADPASIEPLVEAERPGVQPPSFYQHTVARGDRAESISRKYFGTEAHWQAVMRANPKTDFQNLRVGQVIRVPVDPKNIQGIKDQTAPASKDEEQAPVGVEYIVENGDTLTGLAHRFYGKASVYQWIIDANIESLGADGKKLRPGMKIIIPAAPAGAGP